MSDHDLDRDAWIRLAQLAELGVLSASLLHELRQPLFAVKAIAQLSKRRGRALEGEHLEQLLVHVVQIEDLLDHYAGYGRIVEPALLFDLNEPVRGALEMLAHRRRQVRAMVDAQLSPDALLVHGRPAAARQIVVNVLQNAYDAIEGQPERRVSVRSENGGGMIRLIVQDSGPGVPLDLRGRLFEPFVTTKPAGRGTGLGLYIAQQLVQEAEGLLELTFPEEGGTRVEVQLPVAKAG